MVLAARNRAPLQAVAAAIEAEGGSAEVTLVDARDPASAGMTATFANATGGALID